MAYKDPTDLGLCPLARVVEAVSDAFVKVVKGMDQKVHYSFSEGRTPRGLPIC